MVSKDYQCFRRSYYGFGATALKLREAAASGSGMARRRRNGGTVAEVILPAGRPLNREMVGAGMGLLGLAGGGTTPQPGEKVFVECPEWR